MTPLFSIITATYNAKETLPSTLASIDSQTLTDYEHLVMDGASTDSTLKLLVDDPNPRRIVMSEPDKGIYDAMNKGMSIAKGTYYIFLNSGDTFHSPDTLAQIAEAIHANDYPGIVYGQTNLVDNNRRFIAPRHLTAPEHLTYESFANGMMVCHQAFVALAKIAPMYNTDYRFSADYDWCIQCLQHSRKNVYLHDIMIDYLYEGLSTRHRRASLIERFRIMCYYYGTAPTVRRHLGFIHRFISHRSRIKSATKNTSEKA